MTLNILDIGKQHEQIRFKHTVVQTIKMHLSVCSAWTIINSNKHLDNVHKTFLHILICYNQNLLWSRWSHFQSPLCVLQKQELYVYSITTVTYNCTREV